ncbi:MAG TPA: hypothetical protein VGV15_23775 [Terriglobales bacterium]|nr:hypothetical protein [Terriglobales bacterium]
MKNLCRSAIPAAMLSAVILLAFVQPMPAQVKPTLVGTTGACNNLVQGGPCTQTSTLVQIDSETGALVRVIGPVGFTVNGLAWDGRSKTLFASTSVGDTLFHGLITINLNTGAGKIVNKKVVNFGLAIDQGTSGSPIHSITVDSAGNMVGWYDEFGPAGTFDTFVQINKKSGVATEFTNTGINTSQNGLSFSNFNLLWNIDSPRAVGGVCCVQTAYLLDPGTGKPVTSTQLSPPTNAALGDFNPVDNFYYGLNFTPFSAPTTFFVRVDPLAGTVTTVGQTADDLHAIAFIK